MKSPFPGMDPYLESRWADVHSSLIITIREALQPRLPASLRARAEERVLLEDVARDTPVSYRADVAVVERPTGEGARAPGVKSTATQEEVTIEFPETQRVERWLQIIDVANGNSVVTAIEILRAWNKTFARGNDEYQRKVRDYQRAGINLVKIDLLRQPSRKYLTVTPEALPADMRSPYVACVCLAQRPSKWTAYPIRLRQALPAIPIPLRPEDAPVFLNLQEVLERVYVGGGHDDIDYRRPLEPALGGEEEAWMDGVLRQAGRR
jgi:hypothetical protein